VLSKKNKNGKHGQHHELASSSRKMKRNALIETLRAPRAASDGNPALFATF